MDMIMKPGEEVTGRIRWEQPVLTLWGYIAGETRIHTFQIHCPSDGHDDWTLTSSLPGQHEWRLYCDGPDALRKAAEGWVAEFASSLGAVFGDAVAADLRSRADELEAMVCREPRQERDNLLFSAGLKRAADLIEHGDQPAVATPAPMAGEGE